METRAQCLAPCPHCPHHAGTSLPSIAGKSLLGSGCKRPRRDRQCHGHLVSRAGMYEDRQRVPWCGPSRGEADRPRGGVPRERVRVPSGGTTCEGQPGVGCSTVFSQQGWEVPVWNQAAEKMSPGGIGAWRHSGGRATTDCGLGAHSFQEQLPRSRLCQ